MSSTGLGAVAAQCIPRIPPTIMEAWIYSISATVGLSLLGGIGVCCMSCMRNPHTANKMLMMMMALAAGTLMGDAVLHLIPEIMEGDGEVEGTATKPYLNVMMVMLIGFLTFFTIEHMAPNGGHGHSHGGIAELSTLENVDPEDEEPHRLHPTESMEMTSVRRPQESPSAPMTPSLPSLSGDGYRTVSVRDRDPSLHNLSASRDRQGSLSSLSARMHELAENETKPEVNEEGKRNGMSHLTIPVPDTPSNNQHSPLPIFATRFPLRVRSESTESFHLQMSPSLSRFPPLTTRNSQLTPMPLGELIQRNSGTVTPIEEESPFPNATTQTWSTKAIMVIVADSLHNFTDGIGLGAAFAVDLQQGLVLTLAMGLHEIGHELGNFGLLVKLGFSIRRALFANMAAAMTSLLGAIAVNMVSSLARSATAIRYILSFTCGSFIYIACCTIIPVLLASKSSTTMSGIHVLIMCMGFVWMWLLAYFEPEEPNRCPP